MIRMRSGSTFCNGVLNRPWGHSRLFASQQPWKNHCVVKMPTASTSTSREKFASVLTRVSLEPFSYTATTGHVVRPNCAANYLEATGSSSADGTARGRGAAYRAQPATGHISMCKPTNMARCLQKQIGPCKQISGCRQNGLMTSFARGKLSRDQWLQYAADTTIGFQFSEAQF